MNKDFERCCSFLADMIIKYAPEIKEEVEVCMMIKDSIDDEKVSSRHPVDNMLRDVYIYYGTSFIRVESFGFILSSWKKFWLNRGWNYDKI